VPGADRRVDSGRAGWHNPATKGDEGPLVINARTKKVLFVIAHQYHRASLDPIYECMKDRPGYDIYYSCIEEKAGRLRFFQKSLRREMEARLREEGLRTTDETEGFDAVVTGDILRDARPYGDALLCFINHGTGIKTILYRHLAKHLETPYMIFVEGDYRKRKIEEFGVRGASRVFVVGYPKLDPIFGGGLDRDSIMKRWGLDPAKKTVLFAPTYKPTCIDVVRERILTETTGYNLIIKLHHYSWRGRYAPHWHHKIYEKAVGDFPNARLIPVEEHNILPFIFVADTMISEASSTIFEFLALGKIGVIFDLDCGRLKHSDGMPILDEDNRRFLEGAFIHIRRPEEIRPAVEKALNSDDKMKADVIKHRDELFYKLDGHASERIVETIDTLLGERR
jgi:hypothetical protein